MSDSYFEPEVLCKCGRRFTAIREHAPWCCPSCGFESWTIEPEATHEQLWAICWKPKWWPENAADKFGADCSCGCKWFHVLEGRAGADWGVCFHTKSPHKGKLTFEHFGCKHFETWPEEG